MDCSPWGCNRVGHNLGTKQSCFMLVIFPKRHSVFHVTVSVARHNSGLHHTFKQSDGICGGAAGGVRSGDVLCILVHSGSFSGKN